MAVVANDYRLVISLYCNNSYIEFLCYVPIPINPATKSAMMLESVVFWLILTEL